MVNHTTRLGKQHILEIAEMLFTENGYQSVSIRDIAQASGVTNAAIYYHFPSKEALFDEVVEKHAEKLADRMDKAREQATETQDRIKAILGEYARQVFERRSPLFSLHRKPDKNHSEQVHKNHYRQIKRILTPLENTLRIAFEQGELRQIPDDFSPAFLLLGLFHGMLQQRKYCTDKKINSRDIELVVDIFWHGIKQ